MQTRQSLRCLILMRYVPKSCADPENIIKGWGGGGPENLSTYFTEGRMDLTREAFGPEWSNCFSRVVRTSISKATYSNFRFSSLVGGGGGGGS